MPETLTLSLQPSPQPNTGVSGPPGSSTDISLSPDPLTQSQPIGAAVAGDLAAITGAAKTMLVGSALVTIGGTVAAIGSATVLALPAAVIVGAILAAVGALVGLAGRLFGNKWHTSSNVRWLLQWYEFYVEGNSGVTSSNHVHEGKIQDCYNWFTAVTGVPVYDNLRIHALKGTNKDTGKPLEPKQSYHTRAINYLSFWDAKEVTYNNAYAAAQIADIFQESGRAGAWAEFPFAKFWFERITVAELGQYQDQKNIINALETDEGQPANKTIEQNYQADVKAIQNLVAKTDESKTQILWGAAIVLLIAFLFIFRKRIF